VHHKFLHLRWKFPRNVSHIFEIPDPFAYSLYNFYGATIKTNGVIRQNSVWPCVKDHTALCECAKSRHRGAFNCRKSFTTIVLGDHCFALSASNFSKLTTFRTIFSHAFTAHVQKRLFMIFRLKFWRQHSIHWPRFLDRARYFADLRILCCFFAFDKVNVRHISTSGLDDLRT